MCHVLWTLVSSQRTVLSPPQQTATHKPSLGHMGAGGTGDRISMVRTLPLTTEAKLLPSLQGLMSKSIAPISCFCWGLFGWHNTKVVLSILEQYSLTIVPLIVDLLYLLLNHWWFIFDIFDAPPPNRRPWVSRDLSNRRFPGIGRAVPGRSHQGLAQKWVAWQ